MSKLLSLLQSGPTQRSANVLFNPWSDEVLRDDAVVGTSGALRRTNLTRYLEGCTRPSLIIVSRCSSLWGTHLSGIPMMDVSALQDLSKLGVQSTKGADSAPPLLHSAGLWMSTLNRFPIGSVLNWSVMPWIHTGTPPSERASRRLTVAPVPDELLEEGYEALRMMISAFPNTQMLALSDDTTPALLECGADPQMLQSVPDFKVVSRMRPEALEKLLGDVGARLDFIKTKLKVGGEDAAA